MNTNYDEIKKRLEAILDPESFLHKEEEIIAFECDALTYYRVRPVFVVLPSTAEQVSEIIKVCYEFNMPFVPRGAGTGLSGGALPVDDGVLISLAKMNQILEARHLPPQPVRETADAVGDVRACLQDRNRQGGIDALGPRRSSHARRVGDSKLATRPQMACSWTR